jgi:hypothetical protein
LAWTINYMAVPISKALETKRTARCGKPSVPEQRRHRAGAAWQASCGAHVQHSEAPTVHIMSTTIHCPPELQPTTVTMGQVDNMQLQSEPGVCRPPTHHALHLGGQTTSDCPVAPNPHTARASLFKTALFSARENYYVSPSCSPIAHFSTHAYRRELWFMSRVLADRWARKRYFG